MANAQRLTRLTRYLDIEYFLLLDWVQENRILLHAVATQDNASYAMIKVLSPILFYRHSTRIMGMYPHSK